MSISSQVSGGCTSRRILVDQLALHGMRTFDVVIVGGRCGGASLGWLLARRGMNVSILEKGPDVASDRKPAQAVQADVLAFLQRNGLMSSTAHVFGPFMNRIDLRMETYRSTGPYDLRPGQPGGCAFVRRSDLDPLMLREAGRGATIMTGTRVVGLVNEAGRVVGVTVERGGRTEDIAAALVVGADGRTSTVARLVGARYYNCTSTERAYCWGYFDHVSAEPDPAFVIHRVGSDFFWAGPSSHNHYFVGISFALEELHRFRRDLSRNFVERTYTSEALASRLHGARLIDTPRCAVRFNGYFREPTGPGWVLIGDAGHFKDPVAGRGMGDALIQVDTLVSRVERGLAGRTFQLDSELTAWGRERDRTLSPHYWLAYDLSLPQTLPRAIVQLLDQWGESEAAGVVADVLCHQRDPREVLAPRRMLRAAAELARQEPASVPMIAHELALLACEEIRRRWRCRWPDYTESTTPSHRLQLRHRSAARQPQHPSARSFR